MRFPKNLLNPNMYDKPDFYLCETDKEMICKLETTDTNASFKFNSCSEVSFDVSRVYNSILNGETCTNPFYDKIEAPRLILVQNFGYFEIQSVELISDGIKEVKHITANSLEYTLSTKYLENFYINTGRVDSLEVLNAKDPDSITPITLYNASRPELSLLHLILEKIYGWKIGHVDRQLQTLSRQFEIDRESVYDFIMNEICEKFNCYVTFDTVKNIINIYAEAPTARFMGDGKTSIFIINNANAGVAPFSRIETVSVDGYKTTRWTYGIDGEDGVLVLEDIPEDGRIIEAVGVDSTWDTDVFVSFDNLCQEVNINYSMDDIKTVLTVTYGDDYDIREVNLGLPYLTDLSYYYNVDWMGKDLYDAYTAYLEKANSFQSEYANNSKEILKLNDHISYEEHRLSLEYSLAKSVNSTTVGTYYIKQQNSDGSYYYKEVSLPSEYLVGTDYYSNATTNLNEDKVDKLYLALRKYFQAHYQDKPEIKTEALNDLSELSESFKFMKYTIQDLINALKNASSDENRRSTVLNFLDEMWDEIGRTPLKSLYLASFKRKQEADSGWSSKDHENYGCYYSIMLFINSIETDISQRTEIIDSYEKKRKTYTDSNAAISDELSLDKNFDENQIIRLSSFLREDELHLDDIVETSQDSIASSFKIKQDAMESGRIELRKLCQPRLQFSMDMANIYALPEFEPIVYQFQLGKIIKVGLRPDYIKQSRLLEVNVNFDDFSDFSCEFGELTSLRTQSDIHADLLSQAINAGKSVATNEIYWTRGADQATATDLKIEQGLLDATTQIKSIDGTQGVVIDKYGIKLLKNNEDGSVDPHQIWMVNNMILMSDDGFQTSRSAIGEVTVDGNTYYGLIAELVLAGYIEGSRIVGSDIEGGTINIGDGAFKVDERGTVTMSGGASIDGYVTEDTYNEGVKDIQDKVNDLSGSKMYRVEIIASGPTTFTAEHESATLECKVYTWDTEDTSLDASLFNWKRTSVGSYDLIGDGSTTTYDIPDGCIISNVYIDEVAVNASSYTYNGTITFTNAPANGARISIALIYDTFDLAWNTDHTGTKTINITHEDVYETSTFVCEVDLPGLEEEGSDGEESI